MRDWMLRLRAMGVAACLGVLAACGGGGGGEDDSVAVTVDRSSLAFAGFVDHPGGSEALTFTLVEGEGEFYGLVEVDRDDAFYSPSLTFGDTSAVVYLTPLNRSPGKTTGSLTFKLCRDVACQRVAWSRTIPYTMAVYQLQGEAVAIDSFEGASGGQARLAVLPPGGAADLEFTVADEHLYGPAPWLGAHADDDDIVVTASAEGLAQGSYNRSLEVRIANAPQAATVSLGVTLSVGAGLVLPSQVQLDQRVDTAAGAMKGSVPLAFNGGLSPAWTATSDSSWLVLDTVSGAGPGELRFHIDAAAVSASGPWEDLQAQVVISPAGLSAVSVPVTLRRRLPHVTWAHPSTVPSSSGGTVKVYGRGFSQLTGIGSLMTGGLTVTGGAIESDTVARLEIGATAPGSHAVAVANAVAQTTPRATLAAVANAGPAQAFVPSPGNKRTAVFDDTRQAVFAVGNEAETVVRIRQESGAWKVATLWVPFINSLALAADRSTLYATVGDDEVVSIDADSLTIRERYKAVDIGRMRETSSRTVPLALTRDGRLWVNQSGGYFDTVAKRFGHADDVADLFHAQQTSLHAPADGSRLFLTGLSNFGEFAIYSADTGTTQRAPTMPQVYERASLGADGALMLADNHWLYRSGDWALVGEASVSGQDDEGWRAGVLSTDGRRVYRVGYSGSSGADRIDVFDATQRVPGSSELVRLGGFPIPTVATCDSWSSDWCDVLGTLSIDALGMTLYWTGSNGVAVLPIPAELRAAATMPRTVLRRAAR